MMMRDFYLLLLLFKIKAESKCNLLLISRSNNDLTIDIMSVFLSFNLIKINGVKDI